MLLKHWKEWGEDGTIVLWDIAAEEPIQGQFDGLYNLSSTNNIAFSPDREIIATGFNNNEIILWETATMQPLGDPLLGHDFSVAGVAFSPDGNKLASASRDDTIILWDADSRQPLGNPLTTGNIEGGASIISFSLDGKTLTSINQEGTLYKWDITEEAWHAILCERVGRNFSQEEWAYYFPEEPHRITCQQWPEGE